MEIGHMVPQPGGMLTWFNAVFEHDDNAKYKLSCVWNKDVPDCGENAALRGMQGTTDSPSQCNTGRKLIRDNVALWALAPDDDAFATARSVPNYFLASPVKVQLKTVDGVLTASRLRAQEAGGRPWLVPSPLEQVPVIEEQDVILLEGLAQHVFKVRVHPDDELCYKQVYRSTKRSFLQEVKMLANLPLHPHIIGLHGVVGCGEGRVGGILLDYIDGVLLSSIKSASPASCRKWKAQMQSALDHLHDHKRVWGDAKPANTMITREENLVLIDFGGQRTRPWVDEELMETQEGDNQAYGRICTFIDGLVQAE